MIWLAELAEQVRQLSPQGFWFIFALLIVGSIFAFYSIWRSLHRARIIEDTPTARVRSAHQGYVELEGVGRLLDGPPIAGPLTGIACLWYRYKVEHRESRSDRRNAHWSTVRSGVSDGLFLLEDGTGRCIVDPDGAEVIAGERDIWYGHNETPARGPGRGGSWLRLSGGDYRYSEERLMPGAVYALGWFSTVRNAPGDVGTEVAALLRDWKTDRPGLLARFDRNGDGQIDVQEWDRAREAALQEVLKLRTHRPHAPASHVLNRPASDRHPFLLSAESQATLTRRYRRHSLLALTGSLVGVVITYWLVTARFAALAG